MKQQEEKRGDIYSSSWLAEIFLIPRNPNSTLDMPDSPTFSGAILVPQMFSLPKLVSFYCVHTKNLGCYRSKGKLTSVKLILCIRHLGFVIIIITLRDRYCHHYFMRKKKLSRCIALSNIPENTLESKSVWHQNLCFPFTLKYSCSNKDTDLAAVKSMWWILDERFKAGKLEREI